MDNAYKRVKTKTILQMEATECGAACLAMIFHYYGKELSLEEMREAVDVSRDGCKAGNIMRACPSYHMEVHGYRKELEALYELTPPCIIHWNFNHFVVYEGRNRNYAFINDPAAGRRRLTLEELDQGYTGVVMTFRPEEGFQKEHRQDPMWAVLTDNIRSYRKEYALLVALGLMLTVPDLALAACAQFFVEKILGNGGDAAWLSGLIGIMVFCVLFRANFSLIRHRLLDRLRHKILLLRDYRLLRHLFRLPMIFFDQRYSGEIANRLNSNIEASSFLSGEFTDLIINCVESLFFLSVMFFYSARLTLFVLAGAALKLFLVVNGSAKLKERSIRMNQEQGKLQGTLFAGINSVESMKASGSESAYIGRLLGIHAGTVSGAQQIAGMQQILQSAAQGTLVILNVLILLLGSIFVLQDTMTVGSVVAYSTLFALFMEPVTTITGFFMRLQSIRSTLLRIQDIEHYSEEKKYAVEDRTEWNPEGKLELSGIEYGYSRLSGAVVQDFDLTLMPGRMAALVGSSGSGKSTLAKVVGGLYSPWNGEVLIDGVSIAELSGRDLQRTVAVVSQNISVFSGTIRDNITLWNQEIPDADIIRAAKDACIHEYITSRGGGYESLIEEGGRNFSVGQRQRLEIARALVLNPAILILDEATSALDPITEMKVLENIRARGCTCLMVAHRLSAIRDCDEIIVLENGKIAERGTHAELLKNDRIYVELVSQE